ncbi:hypothetical protein HDU76_008323, partial [Blyttiomyces sp. JEL0837]
MSRVESRPRSSTVKLNPQLDVTRQLYLFWGKLINFLELCSLQDKLLHIKLLLESQSVSWDTVAKNLRAIREWSPEQYPFWLVFEIEGRLNIRPEQFEMARHMLANP